jgi:squalene cyclase
LYIRLFRESLLETTERRREELNFEKTQGMGISCHLSHHTFDGAFSFIYGDVWGEGSVSAADDPPDLRAALSLSVISGI